MTRVIENLGNEKLIQRFKTIVAEGRLGHAYLFTGPCGVGKSQTALEIAKLINCDKGINQAPCQECVSCRKIDQEQHPDIHKSGYEEGLLKIDQIRKILSSIQLKPFEAKHKVYIIKDVDQLTPEAANALLKTLEEPSSQSLLILTTAFPERVLETVKSRCQNMAFFLASSRQLKERLKQNYRLNEKESHFLAYLSEGCLGQALYWHEQGAVKKKNDIIDHFILKRATDAFIKNIAASKNKEDTRFFLDILLTWFRDMMIIKADIGSYELIHQDRLSDLKAQQEKYSLEDINVLLVAVARIRKLSNNNLNIKMDLLLLRERI